MSKDKSSEPGHDSSAGDNVAARERAAQEELGMRQRVAEAEVKNLELTKQLRAARDSMVRYAADAIRLETERNTLRQELDRTTQDLAVMESQHANLTSLYVAALQLHGTLKREGVISAIQEIIVNLIGSEEFGVYEKAAGAEGLRAIAHVGLSDHHDPATLADVTAAMQRGEPFIASNEQRQVTACIPLKLEEQLIGCIAIYRLLPHKASFEPIDLELFNLLTTHAASALATTRHDIDGEGRPE